MPASTNAIGKANMKKARQAYPQITRFFRKKKSNGYFTDLRKPKLMAELPCDNCKNLFAIEAGKLVRKANVNTKHLYCSKVCFYMHKSELGIQQDISPKVHKSLFGDISYKNIAYAGRAAEFLVAAHLSALGYRVLLTTNNEPYDLIVQTEKGFLRVQVKATLAPIPRQYKERTVLAYCWSVSKRINTTKAEGLDRKKISTLVAYKNDDFDIVALVAMDIGQIAYFAFKSLNHSRTVFLRSPDTKRFLKTKYKNINEYPFEKAIEAL